MRNLKRALSLAMASIMIIGLMVTGAGAVSIGDFSDGEKIVNTEAVSVLTTLNVINGRDDGSYDPTGVVTRGEMAKIICVVLNGGRDPQLGNITANFPDAKGHWAETYIAYCANLNIIAGVGNGNFEPNATVTGAQAAKMLLVALGYNASVEGYTGANWQTSVDVAANQRGLYDGLGKMNTSDGLTRDNAAQMVYNALDVKMVEYSYVITGTADNSLTTKPQTTNGKLGTLMEEKFNAVKIEGVVVANEHANLDATADKGAALDAGKTKISVTNGEDQNVYTGSVTFTTGTGLDFLGRTVSLYVKKGSNAAKADVLGSVILSADNDAVVDASADTIAKVADDKNLNITSETQVAVNYGNRVNYSKYTDPKTAGIEKVLIDNDGDGDVEIVLMNTYTFGKITSYVTSGNGSITVSAKGDGLTANKKADVVGFDDVAKNDYVMAAYIGGKLVVEKADTVTGKLEAYKEKSYTNPTATYSTKLTVDGTDYNVSHVDGYVGGTENISAGKLYGSSNLDNEATFYLDKNGYVAAVGDVAENAYNYALVLAVGTTIDERVKVALPDGTTGTYVFKSSGNSIKFGAVQVGQVYGYSVNSNKELRLTKTTAPTTGTDAKFSKGKTTVAATGMSNEYANQNTVFFYTPGVDDGSISDVNIYAGYSKAPTLKDGANAGVTVYKNGARVVAVVFTGTNLTTANVSDNLYISAVGTSTSSYTNATAFIAGKAEAQSIKVDGATSVGAYTYKINSEGYYELEDVPSGNLVKSSTGTQYGVYSANANTMVIGTGDKYETSRQEYSILSKTLLVNDSAYLDDPFAELGAGPDQGDKISYVIYNSDKEALLIVVKNTKATDTPVVSTDVKVIDPDAGNGYAAPTFYRESATAITMAEKQAALSKVMQDDGCTDISFKGMTEVTFTKSGVKDTTTITSHDRVYKVVIDGTETHYHANAATCDPDGIGTYAKVEDSAGNITYATANNVTVGTKDLKVTTGYVKVTVDGEDNYVKANTEVNVATLEGATGTYYTVGGGAKTAITTRLAVLEADLTVVSGFYKITVAANATNAGANGGVFSMSVVDVYAKKTDTVTITVKVETASADNSGGGGTNGAVVTLGGATITPATLTFTDAETAGSTDTATFTMGEADVTLTMSAVDVT